MSIEQITYSTSQLAAKASIHPNTVRLYEKWGLIAPAARRPNGYRVFTETHWQQLQVVRLVFGAPYTNRRLRSASMRIVRAMAASDRLEALRACADYRILIESEYAAALETAALLRSWNRFEQTGRRMNMAEAAAHLGVTKEQLRNWERNALIDVPREGPNRSRVFGDVQIARLRVIYMLRQNHYSIAAIAQCMRELDVGNTSGAVLALHLPFSESGETFAMAGDQWLETLRTCAQYAQKLTEFINNLS